MFEDITWNWYPELPTKNLGFTADIGGVELLPGLTFKVKRYLTWERGENKYYYTIYFTAFGSSGQLSERWDEPKGVIEYLEKQRLRVNEYQSLVAKRNKLNKRVRPLLDKLSITNKMISELVHC